MHHITALITLAASLTAAPAIASAEAHDGLLVRLTPGVSAAAATASNGDQDLSLKGGAGRLGVTLGWAIAPRLLAHLELLGHAILGPKLELDGATHETDDDVTWGISYAGLGVDYYLPGNLYFSGSAGPLVMTLDAPAMETSKTDLGFAGKVAVGYEWMVGPRWGVGAALELLAGAVPDDDADWGVATLGLALSATYN